MEEAIIIVCPDNFDDTEAQEIIQLGTDELKIKGVLQESSRLFASMEWVVPTTFIVMVSGPFFKSFMEEAGKDAYQMLKSRIKQYMLKRKEIKTKLITSTQSPDKLSEDYDQSLSISLKARLHSKILVNVYVPEKIEGQEAENMLEGAFESLNLIYQQCQQVAPEEMIDKDIIPEKMYMVANLENKSWEMLTSKEMSKRYRNKPKDMPSTEGN